MPAHVSQVNEQGKMQTGHVADQTLSKPVNSVGSHAGVAQHGEHQKPTLMGHGQQAGQHPVVQHPVVQHPVGQHHSNPSSVVPLVPTVQVPKNPALTHNVHKRKVNVDDLTTQGKDQQQHQHQQQLQHQQNKADLNKLTNEGLGQSDVAAHNKHVNAMTSGKDTTVTLHHQEHDQQQQQQQHQKSSETHVMTVHETNASHNDKHN